MATATVEKNGEHPIEVKRSAPGGGPSGGGRFDRSFRPQPAATLALRTSLSRHLALWAVDDMARSTVLLCAQEALTNAITHGGGRGLITVSVSIEDGELSMEVNDRGSGCDPAKLDLESLPDPLGEHGRGLFLIQHLMDDFQIISDRQGTTLRMTLHLCREGPQIGTTASRSGWRMMRRRQRQRGSGSTSGRPHLQLDPVAAAEAT